MSFRFTFQCFSGNSFPLKSIMPWAHTLNSTSSVNSCVPRWFRVIEFRANWLSKIPCLCKRKNLRTGCGFSCDLIVFAWTKSARIRRIESEKSQIYEYRHWRLKKSCCSSVNQNRIKWNTTLSFVYLYQALDSRHDHALNRNVMDGFGSSLGVVLFDWRSYFCISWDGFSALYWQIVFLVRQCVPTLPNEAIADFLTVHIFNSPLKRTLCFFKKVYALVTHPEKRACLFFKVIIADLTFRPALKTLIVTFIWGWKVFFVHAKFPNTHFIRTVQVTNLADYAFIILTVSVECFTHSKCSQQFHTFLQRKIASCRSGNLRNGYEWSILWVKIDPYVAQIFRWKNKIFVDSKTQRETNLST